MKLKAFLLADAGSGLFVLVIIGGMFCLTQLGLQKYELKTQQTLMLEQDLLYESKLTAQKLSRKDQGRKVEIMIEKQEQKSSLKYLPKN